MRSGPSVFMLIFTYVYVVVVVLLLLLLLLVVKKKLVGFHWISMMRGSLLLDPMFLLYFLLFCEASLSCIPSLKQT